MGGNRVDMSARKPGARYDEAEPEGCAEALRKYKQSLISRSASLKPGIARLISKVGLYLQ
jgi:hypothetical protein